LKKIVIDIAIDFRVEEKFRMIYFMNEFLTSILKMYSNYRGTN